MLHFFRAMMQLRKAEPALQHGDLRLLDAPLPLIAFMRGEKMLCLFNLGPSEVRWAVPQAALLALSVGDVAREGSQLVLGPFSGWLGIL